MKLQQRHPAGATNEMQLKTLLNHVQKHKGFVYGRIRLVKEGIGRLVVDVRPRKGRPGRSPELTHLCSREVTHLLVGLDRSDR
jgi:hypothetical protein